MRLAGLALFGMLMAGAALAEIPDSVTRQLPSGFTVISGADGRLAGGSRYYVLALGRSDEAAVAKATGQAPARPVLVFVADRDGRVRLAGRNDHVALRLDEGGQCDPFEDGWEGVVVTGRRFTVQNGVACGQHWTDFLTFGYDPARRDFVFVQENFQSLRMNPSDDPGAEAMIRDTDQVRRADPRHPVRFSDFVPPR